jgi:hypothetical protein
MKTSLFAVSLILAMSLAATAQQRKPYKIKNSESQKPARSRVVAPAGPAANSSATTSKQLQLLEQQSVKSAKPVAAKNPPKSSASVKPALKPTKEQHNPPINFGGTASQGPRHNTAPANPYAGRLKKKGVGNK